MCPRVRPSFISMAECSPLGRGHPEGLRGHGGHRKLRHGDSCRARLGCGGAGRRWMMDPGLNPCPTSKRRGCGLNTPGPGLHKPGFAEVPIPSSALTAAANSSGPRQPRGSSLLAAKRRCRALSATGQKGLEGLGFFAEHAVMSPSQTKRASRGKSMQIMFRRLKEH